MSYFEDQTMIVFCGPRKSLPARKTLFAVRNRVVEITLSKYMLSQGDSVTLSKYMLSQGASVHHGKEKNFVRVAVSFFILSNAMLTFSYALSDWMDCCKPCLLKRTFNDA